MKFIEQSIPDLYLIISDLHQDNRGVFRRSFCENEFRKNGINFNSVQGNISENFKKHTLRGFHYQKSPSKESKVLSCITGSLFNVVIDLREDSKTYHKSAIIEISSDEKESIYVPSGCANAFLTMTDNTIVHYYMGDFFSRETYHSIRYNDPMFDIKWPYEPQIISEKDLKIPDYQGK